jgi:putative transposase
VYTGPERKRTRLRGFDYRDPGPYVVTIVTQHRIHRFGTVDDGFVVLNPAGRMVQATWRELQSRFPGTVLDAGVLMPNHLHAILTLAVPDGLSLDGLPSLSDVIGWFKTMTTRRYTRGVRTNAWPPFDGHLWQPGFYEHIVRGETGLARQQRYIAANPSRWHEDPYHD